MNLWQATGLTLTDNTACGNGGQGLAYNSLSGITMSGNLLSRNAPRSDFRL